MDPRWKQTPWGFEVSTRDQLIRAIGRMGALEAGRRYVWRGVTSRQYTVRSALIREMFDSMGDLPDEEHLRAREKQILQMARDWRIAVELGATGSDLHLLALLQHHGVPTRLIDVTSNPMTALWFACRPDQNSSQAGVLFAFDVTSFPEFPTIELGRPVTYEMAGDPLGAQLTRALRESAASGDPFLVQPSLPDGRMMAQEGLFIAGATPSSPAIAGLESFPLRVSNPPAAGALETLFAAKDRPAGRPRSLAFLALVIPPGVKARVLPILQATYNRRRRVLFPDLAGFAAAYDDGDVNA